MIFVACSGFPVPVSRYFQSFNAVEISDTELGIPGAGTRRRWLREAPRGSAFSVLGPKRIGASGFAVDRENVDSLNAVGKFARLLKARALVLTEEGNFGPTRGNRSRLGKFFDSLPEGLPQPVIDLPHWSFAQLEAVLGGSGAVIAYDPLKIDPPPGGRLAYARLPGPSGYRSRYDEPSIEKIARRCARSPAEVTLCVFCNIDRFVNASSARALLKKART
jgi:uncharacterized protein YecE (DUF72 family)